MVDKYRCYGKDDFGDPYDALSMKDPYGEWVRAEDYDALDAAATALGTEVQRLNMEGGAGFPQTCDSCLRVNTEAAQRVVRPMFPKVACSICGKKVKAVGLKDHERDAHGMQHASSAPSREAGDVNGTT